MKTSLSDFPDKLMWEKIAPRLAKLYDNSKVTNWSIDKMYKTLISLETKNNENKTTGHSLEDLYSSLSDAQKIEFEKLISEAEKLL
jgi:hypothetical protein